MLSGFVIGYSYEDRLRTNMSVQTFTLARIVRLYPLYLVGTLLGLLNIGLHALHMHDRSLLTFLPVLLAAVLFLPNLFARGLSPQFYPLDGPAWSLFFEIVANIVFAAMVRRRLAPSAVMLVLALVFLAVLALTPQSSNSGWSFETFWPALARVGYSFFAGVLLCRMFRKGARATLSGRPAWFTMFAVCSVICFCIAIPLSVPQARVFSLMVTAVVFPGLVLLGAGCEVTSPWQPLCNFLGDTSYPLYAIHSPTFYFIALVQHFHRPELTWAFSLLLVLPFALSWWLRQVLRPADPQVPDHLSSAAHRIRGIVHEHPN